MENQPHNRPPHYLLWIICGVAGFFYFYEYLLRVIPSVMTQQLVYAYQLSAATFSNLVGGFYFIYIPMQLFIGIFFYHFTSRRLLTFGSLSCALGCLLFANANYFWIAFVGRLLMGCGAAFMFLGALKLVSVWSRSNLFTLIVGIVIGFGMLGGLVGDIVLTAIVNKGGWRLANYFVGAIGALLALAVFFVLRDRKKQKYLVDEPYLFCNAESGCSGLIDVVKNSQMWINCVIGCLLFVPLSGFAETWGISYLMQVVHMTKSHAAFAVAMIFFGWLLGAPIIGWISNGIKQRRLPLTLGSTLAAILISIVLYVPNLGYQTVCYILFLFGFFSGSSIIVFLISREINSSILTGAAMAFTNMMVMLSGAVIPLIGLIVSLTWRNSTLGQIPNDAWSYQVALSVLPCSLLVAIFLTFYLQDTYCKLELPQAEEV